MDSIDTFLDALDNYRTARRRIPSALPPNRAPVPSPLTEGTRERAQAEADAARDELRAALRACVVEAVREDYRDNGSLRQTLADEASLLFHIPGQPPATAS